MCCWGCCCGVVRFSLKVVVGVVILVVGLLVFAVVHDAAAAQDLKP